MPRFIVVPETSPGGRTIRRLEDLEPGEFSGTNDIALQPELAAFYASLGHPGDTVLLLPGADLAAPSTRVSSISRQHGRSPPPSASSASSTRSTSGSSMISGRGVTA